MRVKFAQSTRKHRIAKGRAFYVIDNNEPVTRINTRGEVEYEWVGTDERGLELEVVGAQIDDDLILVFHVMPTNYRRNR
ncbi:hypothetical protein [Aeromicrobium sp. CTD01-1L150]|uniref:hypothetical protein n=1 Tax=Aeromicrobium sp. CTD01-1L150 TaxID=3341830 RepID=UPI0035C0A083